MDTKPETQDAPEAAAPLAGLRLGAYMAWSAVLVYSLWPSFRWQIEYFKTPGPAVFYGVLIIIPLLAAAALFYCRIRGRRSIPWEPLLIGAPLLILVLRQPGGAASAILLLGSSLAVGRFVLVRLGLPARTAEGEWIFSLLTGVSVWAWVLSMTALAGLMSRPLLWATAVLPAVWSLKLAPPIWRSLRDAPRRWASDVEVHRPLAGLMVPFLALALLSGVLVAAAPPITHDAVVFHLPLVQKWAQTGSLTPSFHHPYSFFPQSFEVLMAWAYSIGGTQAAKALCFSLAMLGFAVCWRLVRLLGGSRQTAAAAMAIVVSAPALQWTASVLKNDFLMATLQVGCAACFLRWRADRNFRWILLGCWFLGSSFGVKHSALFAAVGLGLLALRAIWEQQRRAPALAAIVVILACTASIWHVRAYLVTGDPGYPAGVQLASRFVGSSPTGVHNPFVRMVRLVGGVHGYGGSHYEIFENILPAPAGALFSLLFPLAFFVGRGRFSGDRRAIGLVVAVTLTYWMLTVSNLRYALTPLLLLACLLAIGLSQAYAEGSAAARRLLSGLVLLGLLFGWTGSLIIENSGSQIRYIAGLISEDAYIASAHWSLPAIRRLGQLAAPEDRILGAGCCYPGYYPFGWKFDCPFGVNPNAAVRRASEMMAGTSYQYFIGPAGVTPPWLAANEVVYRDRVCTVRRFLPATIDGQSPSAR